MATPETSDETSFTQIGVAARGVAQEAQRAYLVNTMLGYLACATDLADGANLHAELGQAMCAALDTIGGGYPEYTAFGGIREEAGWWADLATPAELECYVGAGLRAIERKTFAPRAQKRLFVALWEAMDAADRQRFLSRVDPDGTFVRGAA